MSFVMDIFRAVAKPQFYKTVKERGFSRAFLHMLLLTVIYASLITIFASKYVLTELNDFAAWARDNFPTITIQAGKITTDENEPYFASFEAYDLNFVFSTQTVYQDTASLNPNTVLIESARVLYFDGEDIYEPFSVDEFSRNVPEGAMIQSNAETIERFRQGLNRLFGPLTFFFMFLAAIAGYFLALFFFSLYALIVDRFLHTDLHYNQLLAITAYSLTALCILFWLRVIAAEFETPNPLGFGILLTLIYITLGVRANRTIESNESNTENS